MGKSLQEKFYLIKKIEWRLRQLSTNDVVIHDLGGSDLLLSYLREFKCIILHTRQERYYLLPTLIALIKSFIFQKQFSTEYEDSFIRIVRPRLIISVIDNNMNFHQVARRHPGIKTILIQNGYRTKSGDLFGRDKPAKRGDIDHIFIFGSTTLPYYTNYLQGNFHFSGSLMNNSTPIGRQTKTDSLVFISQFTPGLQSVMRVDGQHVSAGDFYSIEMMVLPLLSKWCQDNNKQLVISGTQSGLNRDEELEFFGAMIPKSEFLLMSKESMYSSYELIDEVGLFCFIDSTLGYESLLREARGVAVNLRGSILNDESYDFCWPKDVGSSGPFWTDTISYREIEKILNFALHSDQETWKLAVASTMSGVMEFDLDNSGLKEILKGILVKPTELKESL